MSSRSPSLNAEQAGQLFTLLHEIVTAHVRTGKLDDILKPTTLLNAGRLLLASEPLDPARCAVIGMLHMVRSNHLPPPNLDFDAAVASFSHIYRSHPHFVFEPLLAAFEERPPAPQPLSEIQHIVARVLVHEYGRDGGGLLLDAAILLYEAALCAPPSGDEDFAVMQFNLASALEARLDLIGDDADLGKAIDALRRAARRCPVPSATARCIFSLTGRMLNRAFEATGDPAFLSEAADAFRSCWAVAMMSEQDGAADAYQSSFQLGAALWARFGLVGNGLDLEEAIEALTKAVELCPADDPLRPGVLSSLSTALLGKHRNCGDAAALDAALHYAEKALAAAPANHEHSAALAQNVSALRQLEQSKSSPYRPA